jgi:hypothetical protein
MFRAIILALLLAQPELQIDAPPELAAIRARLQSIDAQRFAAVARLVGLSDADASAAIHVILAAENSDFARGVPMWIAGFAAGASNQVVIFPARSPAYPDDTLEDVLRHEVAHVLIWRASAGRPVPRWFNEGLAMSAERRRFEDQTQLLYQLITGSRTNLDELDRLFYGGQNDQTRAYVLSGALVQDVLQQHGSRAPGEILSRVARGLRFDAAFEDVTGSSPQKMESEFWDRQKIWTTWVPIIASSTTLWLVITMLAIFAIVMRRRRNRKIEEQWEKEDVDDDRL